MRLLFYEAISYNWGTMDTTEEILVDGCRKMVTKSVYEILASSSYLFLPKLLCRYRLTLRYQGHRRFSRKKDHYFAS
jgi:hypothetical protein